MMRLLLVAALCAGTALACGQSGGSDSSDATGSCQQPEPAGCCCDYGAEYDWDCVQGQWQCSGGYEVSLDTCSDECGPCYIPCWDGEIDGPDWYQGDVTDADEVSVPPPTCEALTAQAEAFLQEKIAELHQCSAPTACFVIPFEGDCYDLCPQTVGSPALADVYKQEANEQICAQRGDCTYEFEECAFPTTAFTDCVDGSCVPLP